MVEQKAADCAVWKDEALPISIQKRVNAAGEAEEAFKAETGPEPTPDQKAILDWFNRDAGRVTKRQTYCGA